MRSRFQRVLALSFVLLSLSFSGTAPVQPQELYGSYQSRGADGTVLSILMTDDYFSLTSYHPEQRKFNYTWGGPFTFTEGNLRILVEFDTFQKEAVGNEVTASVQLAKEGLEFNGTAFKRIDDGKGDLTGCWRITGRMQNGSMVPIPKRARKTLKLLSGSRFQWMAINTETGEFSGTGGGRYTFKDGKYTEYIEFFSRDSSRIGASLSFDGRVENGVWNHSGKSSKGDPIAEVWSREKQ